MNGCACWKRTIWLSLNTFVHATSLEGSIAADYRLQFNGWGGRKGGGHRMNTNTIGSPKRFKSPGICDEFKLSPFPA